MNTKSNKTEEIQTEVEKSSVDKSKRSFSKAGMAAPILLSFSSRPAWAGMSECSFNQAMSGNMSQDPNRECTKNSPSSRSPGRIRTQRSQFPSVDGFFDETFNDLFNRGGPRIRLYEGGSGGALITANPTMQQVLKPDDGQKLAYEDPSASFTASSLGQHYAAAYLLAASSNFIYPYTVEEIVNSWLNDQSLFPILELIQDDDLTVAEVNAIINP